MLSRRSIGNLENGDKPFDCTASLHSVSPGAERREEQSGTSAINSTAIIKV